MNQIAANKIVGKLAILTIGMYGIHIYGQIILFDNKGFLPSTFVALWLLLLTVIILTTTIRQVISQSILNCDKLVILIFLFYYVTSIFFYTDKALSYHFSNIMVVVLPGFMLGVISNVSYIKLFPFQKLVSILNSNLYAKRLYLFAGLLSLFFITYQAYLFYVNKLGLAFALVTVNNEYYQDFGDYFIIFYCGWLAIRENYRNSLTENKRSYFLFSILMVLELTIAILFLQLIGSNKAPLTILLIGIGYLIFSFPSSLRLQLRQFSTFLFLFIFLFLIYNYYIDPELLNSLRFFGEANSSGLVNNSSVTIRLDQIIETSYDQMNRNWIFGDLTIDDYIHSSLISIQTHLGLIGSLLFWIFIFMQSYFIYFRGNDRISKAITAPVVLVSIISSVFWWIPLWFVIGLIYMRNKS